MTGARRTPTSSPVGSGHRPHRHDHDEDDRATRPRRWVRAADLETQLKAGQSLSDVASARHHPGGGPGSSDRRPDLQDARARQRACPSADAQAPKSPTAIVHASRPKVRARTGRALAAGEKLHQATRRTGRAHQGPAAPRPRAAAGRRVDSGASSRLARQAIDYELFRTPM